MSWQLQLPEPLLQFSDGHLHQVGNASSCNLYIVGLRFQTRAMANRTGGLTTITAHHHTVLYLVLVFLNHLEESVYAWLIVQVLVTVAG